MDKIIEEAVRVLKQGGVVIFPTDTAFGIGCRLDNEEAIKRVFSIRRRPESQATPVLVNSIDMAKKYLQDVPEDVEKNLMMRYWPGALTIVLPCKTEIVPMLARGGTETLGVRIPDHKTTQALIYGTGTPLLGPSANFHGLDTPYDMKNIDKDLINLVDYVVPGECQIKQASTVIDCTTPEWRIIRQGAVKVIK